MHMYQCQDLRLELVCQNIPMSEGQGQQNLQEGGQGLVLVDKEINGKNLNQPFPFQQSESVRTKT